MHPLADRAKDNCTFLSRTLPGGVECIDFFHASEQLKGCLRHRRRRRRWNRVRVRVPTRPCCAAPRPLRSRAEAAVPVSTFYTSSRSGRHHRNVYHSHHRGQRGRRAGARPDARDPAPGSVRALARRRARASRPVPAGTSLPPSREHARQQGRKRRPPLRRARSRPVGLCRHSKVQPVLLPYGPFVAPLSAAAVHYDDAAPREARLVQPT